VLAEIPSLLPRLLASATPTQARAALTMQAQTAHTHSGVVEPLRAALTGSNDPALAAAIDENLPQQPRRCASLRCSPHSVCSNTRSRNSGPDRDTHAAHLNNSLSVRLSDLGRREEALAAIEEAVEIAFLPDLAMSLNNQSGSLSGLGRLEEALAAIEETVEIRRGLAAARPAAFLSDLAVSLNNQSKGLSELGRREDALTAIDEALHLVLPVLERAHYFLPAAGLRLIQTYLTRCEKAECDPDAALTQRMYAVLVSAGLVADDE
jgi:tetratricopeptide (TPR) repeat protein